MEEDFSVDDHSPESDVGVEFHVLYHVSPGRAQLQVRDETRGAREYGVQYQIGIAYSDSTRRLSPPLTFDEARVIDVEGDLLRGEKLIIRMVDNNHAHLAAGAVDLNNWPPDLTPGSIRNTQLDSGVFCLLTLVDTKSASRREDNHSIWQLPGRLSPAGCVRVHSGVDAPHRPANAIGPLRWHG
jgi:hypothetical protein